jgi:hypothetical protein
MGANGTPILLSGNQGGSGWPSSRRTRSAAEAQVPGEALPRVEEYREKLTADQGGRQPLEKADDAKDLRKPLKAAATSLMTLETPAPRSVKCRNISRSGRGAAG